jgi:DNA-binding XRE family transcriptional regulator
VSLSLTAKQIKAARAMLDWSRAELAAACDVSEANIIRLEAGGDGRTETFRKITDAFENHGIVFTQNGGIEPARPELKTYSGQIGLQRFFDDVYTTLRDQGGEVVITGFDESVYAGLLEKDFIQMHLDRMGKLKNYTMRCLIEEGDYNFIANSYCEYKWSRREEFRPVPFYIYGRKVAFIQFDVPVDAPMIVIIQSTAIADAFRAQFDSMWKSAKIPSKTKSND